MIRKIIAVLLVLAGLGVASEGNYTSMIIAIVLAILIWPKADKGTQAPAAFPSRPSGYRPEHEQYVLLQCPDCHNLTACPDMRAVWPGAKIFSSADVLNAIGEKKLEEIDDAYDPESDIEDAAYCPSCSSFFNPLGK